MRFEIQTNSIGKFDAEMLKIVDLTIFYKTNKEDKKWKDIPENQVKYITINGALREYI